MNKEKTKNTLRAKYWNDLFLKYAESRNADSLSKFYDIMDNDKVLVSLEQSDQSKICVEFRKVKDKGKYKRLYGLEYLFNSVFLIKEGYDKKIESKNFNKYAHEFFKMLEYANIEMGPQIEPGQSEVSTKIIKAPNINKENEKIFKSFYKYFHENVNSTLNEKSM